MFGLAKKKEIAPKLDEVAIIIDRLERIVSGKDTRFDWEDFTIQCDDKRAEALRLLFHQICDAFPDESKLAVLRVVLETLKRERNENHVA
jgi:hypothetical protein